MFKKDVHPKLSIKEAVSERTGINIADPGFFRSQLFLSTIFGVPTSFLSIFFITTKKDFSSFIPGYFAPKILYPYIYIY